MKKPKIFCLRCWIGAPIPHEFGHSPSRALLASFKDYDIKVQEAMAKGMRDAEEATRRRKLGGDP